MEFILIKDVSRKNFSGASVEVSHHYIVLTWIFMYTLVVLWPGFNLIADLGIIVKAFAHHLQARWSWTKFYIGRVWYWICGRAVPSSSWLDANWSLGLISRNSTARYLTNEHEGQRINSLSDTLQPPVFDIYASRTFLGYPSSENGAIEGWDIMSLNCHSYHEMWKPDIKAPECT